MRSESPAATTTTPTDPAEARTDVTLHAHLTALPGLPERRALHARPVVEGDRFLVEIETTDAGRLTEGGRVAELERDRRDMTHGDSPVDWWADRGTDSSAFPPLAMSARTSP